MTLYGMLDYGQGFDPLLGVLITPVFFQCIVIIYVALYVVFYAYMYSCNDQSVMIIFIHKTKGAFEGARGAIQIHAGLPHLP